ncbi:ATP-binding protein [Desulfobacter curvatus]|uniref:ATP-binding protein n=1 Tax=Desulfobacter curvatus TaxID=2290 RepID=UPI000361F706|nr:ATP-binding protein [Desulfobacter curvatus]
MSAVLEMMPYAGLSREWKRIEILCLCLVESRAGRQPSPDLIQELKEIQHHIQCLRKEQVAWSRAGAENLPDLALDLLAGIYAPALDPNVALLYQDLQQGRSDVTSLAFLYRLLAFSTGDYAAARHLVDAQGELRVRGLIETEGYGPMMQLKPHPAKLAFLSGLSEQSLHLPGAVSVTLDAGWEDLILPAPQKKMLKEYLLWIHYADRVTKEWEARPLGGPIALFSGSSGTGKTFAASVIANDLGWALHRVDLGVLVSKYIGETEKNLNALFDAAQDRKVLLQFDEVDALMGKRGDVKEARDRYANMEVSHLLSRIEQHRGPCILTTNLSKHIDPAFQRRFHFVITFPRPDAEQRLALWKCLIPKKAPLSKSLDLQLAADAVPLSGGEILNAAIHASVLAASEEKPIDMAHISSGVWRVLQKTDGSTRKNKLRELAQHLPETVLKGE